MGDSTSIADMERAAAAVSMPPLPDDIEFVSGADNPMAAAAMLQEAGLGQEDESEVPLIEDPADDKVKLPGGLVRDNEVFRAATVRELNGEDEEFLARAEAASDFFRYQQVLLERGVTHIGPHTATPEVLDALTIGDRDTLILGVRIATFGATLQLDVTCQHCGVESKIELDFANEVPVQALSYDARQPWQTVTFAKGGYAEVRLATGADARYLATLENATQAEANTELLARAVRRINDTVVSGKNDILALGMSQRHDIIDWMAKNQPGPEFDKVKHLCTVCGKETPLGLTAGDMFRR